MTSHRAFALLLCAAALSACEKRGPQDITGAAPAARVKFFNFGVNAPGVNFYANDTKMTAISSTDTVESTTGTASGQAGANGFYVGIAPGQYTLSGRIAAATDKNLPVASVPVTVADGKAYSFYMSGVYDAAAKKVEAFVVEDAYPASPSPDSIYIRLVNAIPNAGPLVLSFRNSAGGEFPVGTAVAYKAAGNFVAFSGSGVVDLLARNAGSAAIVFTRPAVSFNSGRVYTVTARGDITVTSATAANRPQLDQTANR